MAQDFKDLKIWQEARALTLLVYKISRPFPPDETFALTSQIRRASMSVAANIAEATGRWGEKDKIQLLMIARGSLIETRSHLDIGCGLTYIKKADYTEIDSRYEQLLRGLNAFIKSIRDKSPIQRPTN